MNYKFGGKGGQSLRDSVLTDDCVGDPTTIAMMYEIKITNSDGTITRKFKLTKPTTVADNVTIIDHDCRMRSGDTQSMSFQSSENDPMPPFYNLIAPLEDCLITNSDGTPSLTATTKKQRKINGFAGTAKGMKQVLWERGLYVEGMKADFDFDHPNYSTLSAKVVLHSCEDFREEPTAMQALVRSYGHLVLFGTKGHPEMNVAGIEYDWGASKKHFRRTNNHTARTVDADVRASLVIIALDTAKKTARKARSYMDAYTDESGESFALIEKHVKLKKCHRNILDLEKKYLDKLLNEIYTHVKEVNVEKKLIAKMKKEENNDTL